MNDLKERRKALSLRRAELLHQLDSTKTELLVITSNQWAELANQIENKKRDFTGFSLDPYYIRNDDLKEAYKAECLVFDQSRERLIRIKQAILDDIRADSAVCGGLPRYLRVLLRGKL